MQAHDYIRSTNQNDTKNSSIFEEREEQTKKRQTIPKFGNVRNRNRRKKKEREREKLCLSWRNTWSRSLLRGRCNVVLRGALIPEPVPSLNRHRGTKGVYKFRSLNPVETNGKEETRWDRLQRLSALSRLLHDRWIDGDRPWRWAEGRWSRRFIAHRFDAFRCSAVIICTIIAAAIYKSK